MRNRIVRIAITVALVMVFALPAQAHTKEANHHSCVKTTHSIVVDSTYWGHSAGWSSSVWPGANFDRITNHYLRYSTHGAWYYQHYTRATCWT